MKIRTGFVSNSSSSSFIVKFERRPKSIEELGLMMGDCSPTCSYSSNIYTSEDVVRSLWRTISSGRVGETVFDCEYNYAIRDILDSYQYEDGSQVHSDSYIVLHRCILAAFEHINGKRVTGLEERFDWFMNGTELDQWATSYAPFAIDLVTTELGFWRLSERGIKETHEFKVVMLYLYIATSVMGGNAYFREVYDQFPMPVYVSSGDEYVVSFEFSDNDGDFMAHMEHGDIFRNVPHTRISRH